MLLIATPGPAQNKGLKVGSFDQLFDIGNPGFPGTAAYAEPGQTYRLKGSGANIWFDKDSFSFLTRRMNGDFIIQTQLRFIGEGQEPHRKAGLMIRSSAAPDAAVAACTVHGDGLTSFQFRENPGDTMQEIKFDITGPDVLQLEKKGDRFIMSVAHFGTVYRTGEIRLDLGENLLAGLFICSHNDRYTEEAEFINTRVYNTAPDDLVQYRDYLGSMLEILDVQSGQRKVLASAEGSWQAPNWTPDGKHLIYNSEGKLYRFDLLSQEPELLNTGFATRNNNDHVLSFDGTLLGISHHASEDDGRSVIYVLPSGGGDPERVTPLSPSYLHGWSPDNQHLVYTAERNGEYDIYKIPARGGDEIRLTTAEGLDDGSEYSPDGKYIYFCSTRTGTMQIWRMDADGRNQTQLTFDSLNNWFPHVSPDNQWLVFISFPEEVPADQHPFYERVYLRKMPVSGGEPEVIAYLYGGQGTINVPSWSPDGTKVAFVSNGIF